MADEWIDRALRELGEHLLDRDVPERLRRLVRGQGQNEAPGRDCPSAREEG